MNKVVTFDELVKKVQQQEDTVVQLVKIVAATNHRISDLHSKQKNMEKVLVINNQISSKSSK